MPVVGTASAIAACSAFVATVVVVIDVAAAYMPLPACVAVSTQATVPLVIVTVLPALEQPPEALTETVRPDEAIGVIVNVLPFTAVLGAVKVMVCAFRVIGNVWLEFVGP